MVIKLGGVEVSDKEKRKGRGELDEEVEFSRDNVVFEEKET